MYVCQRDDLRLATCPRRSPDEGRVLGSHEDEEADADELRGREQHVLVIAAQLLLQVHAPFTLVLSTVNKTTRAQNKKCRQYVHVLRLKCKQ